MNEMDKFISMNLRRPNKEKNLVHELQEITRCEIDKETNNDNQMKFLTNNLTEPKSEEEVMQILSISKEISKGKRDKIEVKEEKRERKTKNEKDARKKATQCISNISNKMIFPISKSKYYLIP